MAEILLSWSVSIPSYGAVFEDNYLLVDLKLLQCLETLEGFLKCHFLKSCLLFFFSYWSLIHVLGHLHYLHFGLFILGSERKEFHLRIFTILRGIKSVLLQKKYLLATIPLLGTFFNIKNARWQKPFAQFFFFFFPSSSYLQNIVIRCWTGSMSIFNQ